MITSLESTFFSVIHRKIIFQPSRSTGDICRSTSNWFTKIKLCLYHVSTKTLFGDTLSRSCKNKDLSQTSTDLNVSLVLLLP